MKKTTITKLAFVVLSILNSSFLTACDESANTLHAINGIQVPPDPGAAGKTTLAGINSNNNGIRDDVEIFIAKEYGKDKATYDKAFDFAQKAQLLYTKEYMVDEDSLTNRFPNSDAPRKYTSHIICSAKSGISSKEYVSPIEKQFINTKARNHRYGELFGGMIGSSVGEIQCK